MIATSKFVSALVLATAILVAAPTATLHAETPASAAASTSTTPITPGHIRTTASPSIRVTAKVDDAKRTTLTGHVPQALRHAVDLGRIDPSTPVQKMVMMLKPSDEQRSELHRVLDEQQDKNTANYHQWVTPEQFGQYFGVHDADIAQVTNWLQSQGFSVDEVSKSKRIIRFSGTTGKLESAFQTEIHSYKAGGAMHASNNSDITVPAALAPVIAGVPMNDFFRKSNMTPTKKASAIKVGPKVYGGACTGSAESTCNNFVGPGDFATIFNTAPLLAQGINGTGVKIGIVGRSDILMSDVVSYRQIFNLPSNDPIFVHAGQDNGVQPGDDGESDLDVEISGGYAPLAQVYFVIGTPTFLVDGITNSYEYLVENNLTDIISSSYGSCEGDEGTGGNEFNSQIFEQAAAQGISVFIANGDNGPAGCDDQGGDSYEVLGYAAPAEASTPYTVAVGGTAFNEGASTTPSATTAADNGPYWYAGELSSEANSALSYIPEIPWNGSKNSDASLDPSADLGTLWSGSGAISSYYLQPSWQRGATVPTTDPTLAGGSWALGLSLTNAGSGYTKNPTVTVTGGGCVTEPAITATYSSTTGTITSLAFNFGTQGGTLKGGKGFGCTSIPTFTIAAPTGTPAVTATGIITGIGPMQNVVPLISGVPHRYTPDLSLAAEVEHDGTAYCSEGGCILSSNGGFSFNLVGGTSVAAPSMAGIQALIDQANGGRQGMPGYIYYTLANQQSLTGCNSQLQPTASTGNGTASGVTAGCAFQDITVGDNLICATSGCASSAQKIGFLAGTGYDLATGLGSVNAYNLSTQWSSVVFNSSNTTLNLSQTTNIAHGQSITISGTVAAGSGSGTPTGDVAFILTQGAFGQTVNVNTGALNGTSPFATLSNGTYSTSVSNLPAGTYQLTARYAGDSTYASSVSAPVTITVAPETTVVTINPQLINGTSCTIAPAASNTYTYDQATADIQATVTGASGQGVPTGTVTFTLDGSPYVTETLDPNGSGYLIEGALTSSSCVYDYQFATSPAIPAGVHTLGASYSGDATFNAVTATPVTITVSKLSITPTLTVAPTTNITSGAAVQMTASFSLSALTTAANPLAAAPTGTVSFYEGSTLLGTASVVDGLTYQQPPTTAAYPSYTYTAYATTSTTLITAGGSITAVYNGDTNYNSATSTGVTVTVASAGATTTTVTSNGNPTTIAGTPTFTATIAFVAGGTAPTAGTVAWYDGSVLLGTSSVGTGHTATEKISATSTLDPFVGGSHTITAVYGGTGTTAAPSKGTFTETVTQTPITIALTGKTLGTTANTYTFAAVLQCASGSTSSAACTYFSTYGEYFFAQNFAPTLSTVKFYDGSTLLGSATATTVTLEQGGSGSFTAQLTGINLSAGVHNITATYGDVNYASATSNAVTVKVYSQPVGNLDLAVDGSTGSTNVSGADSLFISGWVADPVDGSPMSNVKVYIDGVSVGAPTLGISRPDVSSATGNSAYANSGYQLVTPASGLSAGIHHITVIAIDSDGLSTTFGTAAITVTPVYAPPSGGLDQAVDSLTGSTTVAQTDSLFASGWAADPLDGSPLSNVKLYIDGAAVTVTPTLNIARPDVASATGNSNWANSGYTFAYAANQIAIGSHTVTVVATNSHGVSSTLGPLSINVIEGNHAPYGHLDIAVDTATGTDPVSVGDSTYASGWSADYQLNGPVQSVKIYVDGVAVTGTATLGQARPDVASAYNDPSLSNVGWYFLIPANSVTAGSHSITAVATDSQGLTTTFGPLSVTYQ